MVIYNHLSHLRTFMGQIRQDARGEGGGVVKLILPMPAFWEHLVRQPIPKQQEQATKWPKDCRRRWTHFTARIYA